MVKTHYQDEDIIYPKQLVEEKKKRKKNYILVQVHVYSDFFKSKSCPCIPPN
jgi:hypothetical protein